MGLARTVSHKLNIGFRWRLWASSLPGCHHGNKTSFGYEAVWVTTPSWTQRRGETFLDPAKNFVQSVFMCLL